MSQVCLSPDAFTDELQDDRRQALWQVALSDSTVVTMDDGRPGVEPHSAWVRLAEHCRQNDLSIRAMWLKFRSNIEKNILPQDADGYYFCKSVLGMLNCSDTLSFYVVGVLREDKLVVQRWQVPELVLVDVEERDASYNGPCLIRSHHVERRESLGGAPG